MQTLSTIAEVRQALHPVRMSGKRIGCVPTMGALHEGHLSLIRRAVADSDFVVVTIFVNPTQFGENEDFSQYPRPLDQDLELCREAGASLIFHPPAREMYVENPQVKVTVAELAECWEGASRPNHFDGVATVVTKVFNIIQPDEAYFGAKDYQQQAIIKTMCRDLNFPVKIVTCPTIREDSGLAMSSRNAYLSNAEREIALNLSRALFRTRDDFVSGELSVDELRRQLQKSLEKVEGLELDYATVVDSDTLQETSDRERKLVALVAAKVGSTRLIDNLELN